MIQKYPRNSNTFENEGSNKLLTDTHNTTDLNFQDTVEEPINYFNLIGVVAKLEVALNAIGQAYEEVHETKAGIFQFVNKYRECYVE